MKLMAYRAAQDLSREAAAKALDVSVETVRRYETGERIPRRAIMRRITEWSGDQVTAADFYPAPAPAASPRDTEAASAGATG